MAAKGGVSTTTTGSLQETPTWALATVCFVFIFLSIFIEHLIHLLSHWLKKHRKTALFEAVERLKSVLMLLGLISLLLAVTQRPIAKICVPNRIANSMLPCHKSAIKTTQEFEYQNTFQIFSHQERKLAASADNSVDHCASKGKTPLISQGGMNQLSIFIFVLAVMQIVYSVVTMALGRAKMKRWETWEKETQTVEYMAANDPNRFRYTRETTFGRRHMKAWTTTLPQLWIKCFFRQFFNSVAKIDYLTLRHGFIVAHLSGNNPFNFQKYIQKSLEEDFKTVVGISPVMWLVVVIFLLVDVHGWNVYLWVSLIPLMIVLAVGTKLEVVVARMALQLKDQNTVITGTPLVQPNDNHFWFKHPRFILTLLHFTLFMNAFEFAFFIWVTVEFGIKSCYHEHIEIIVIRVALAVVVQVLCSYITLPLYALVTQMGSQYKSVILEEQTMHALKQWHAEVRAKRKKQLQSPFDNSSTTMNNSTSTSNSTDVSHHQVPTLAEFATPAITEIIEEHQEVAQTEPTLDEITFAPIDVQLQMADNDHLPKIGINIIR